MILIINYPIILALIHISAGIYFVQIYNELIKKVIGVMQVTGVKDKTIRKVYFASIVFISLLWPLIILIAFIIKRKRK